MKKALAHSTVPGHSTAPKTPARAPFTRRARLAGALALLGLTAGLGLAASRPAHTAGGPIAVTVANSPLPTTAADDHDKQGVQFTAYADFTNNSYATSYSPVYTVPAGKRFVLETVTARSGKINDTARYNIFFNTNGGVDGNQIAANEMDLLPDGTRYPSASVQSHQYADEGTQVYLQAVRQQTSGPNSVSAVFIGYLVDMP